MISDSEGKYMLKLGCHVGMSGKEMMIASVKDAIRFGANTFMLYTGAPQNTKRKDLSEIRIEEATALMKANGIEEFVVHAPYIINLANCVKPETFEIAVEFLGLELARTQAMGSETLVLHPGSHVGEGVAAGVEQIAKGINEVLTRDSKVNIALETMAGKGSEIGRTFEELAMIYDKVIYNDKGKRYEYKIIGFKNESRNRDWLYDTDYINPVIEHIRKIE